jgi:hypothetical protein
MWCADGLTEEFMEPMIINAEEDSNTNNAVDTEGTEPPDELNKRYIFITAYLFELCLSMFY